MFSLTSQFGVLIQGVFVHYIFGLHFNIFLDHTGVMIENEIVNIITTTSTSVF